MTEPNTPSIHIYTMTHIPFSVPSDSMYVPLQVGRALHEDLGYLGDDTGDNISSLNPYYAELSGVYWVWKNITEDDYVGICHYRRFLLNNQEAVYTKAELLPHLQKYDLLTSKKLTLNFSYAYGFARNHSAKDLSVACDVIRKLYPDFYPLFEKRLGENHTYFGNMMICKKTLFDEYCAFLFPIFSSMHPRLNLDTYDNYHKRLYGFLSEFLLMVWCEYRYLNVLECKVGLIGEKNETHAVIEKLLAFFAKKDIASAKSYFLTIHSDRPDILMEASDVSSRLRLCLEMISICEYEMDAYGKICFPIDLPEKELFHRITWLNDYVIAESHPVDASGNPKRPDFATDVALEVARKLYAKKSS